MAPEGPQQGELPSSLVALVHIYRALGGGWEQ
jgi:hypothetical protein